jgi:hypothetical protein
LNPKTGQGPKANLDTLELANVSAIFQKYGRIEEFDDSSDYNRWNFLTYAKRAATIMQPLNNIIIHQLRNYKRKITTLLEEEVVKQCAKPRRR